MACDIKFQLIENIKASPVFGIQLDESVDSANFSQLMVFVRYIHDKTIEKDFLFCHPLETTTKASDVLKLVEDFFTAGNLDWNKLGSVCTDVAPAMLGVRSGFLTLVKQKNCNIHREALASKTMSQPLKQALDCAAKVINYIKVSALNTRPFENYAKIWMLNMILCCFTILCVGSQKETCWFGLRVYYQKLLNFLKSNINKNWRLILLT